MNIPILNQNGKGDAYQSWNRDQIIAIEATIYKCIPDKYLVGDKNNPPTLVHDLNMAGRQATVRMANVRNSLLKNFRIIGGEGDWCSGCNLRDGDEHSGGGVFINVDNWNNESSTVRLQN